MAAFPLNIKIDHSLDSLRAFMEAHSQKDPVCIITDTNTTIHCLPILKKIHPAFDQAFHVEIEAGEKNKNTHSLFRVLQYLTGINASRGTLLVNLGGGMITDMGGFAASIYKRGIPFVHVPTTLLGQIDAAIGGKNGIDYLNYKNLLGTFSLHEPVFLCKKFLDTLPDQEMKNGLAEAFKHGLIANRNYWDQIKSDPLGDLELLIGTSVEIKGNIVVSDPFEKDVRKKLNAGHTIGHAIESWKLNSGTEIAHGLAVAAGIVVEAFISKEKGFLPPGEYQEIEKVMLTHIGKADINGFNFDDLMTTMKQDKKNKHASISFSLIRQIGNATIDDSCEPMIIKKALDHYNSL